MSKAAASHRIHFDDVTLGYDKHPAVHHLTGDIGPGTLLAVVGPNGSGKSTLLKGIAGALPPLDGTISRERLLRRAIAYLPQASELDRGFPATVLDLVSLGLVDTRGLYGAITSGDRERMVEALAAVGLQGFAPRPIETLSGGQLQRALFARLLLQDARLILLDEPFNAIDDRTVSDLLAVIHRWHGENRTVVAVLHDLELVRAHFPDTLLLAREPIAWGETSTVLTPPNLARARAMTEAWDDLPSRHEQAEAA